ncbi:hypothetical protein AGDE_15553 [Angomonas deanei]|uniref:Cilia BBSome complex subunit 10, putative n=1 Tax=Angomonas deanei TaxID=59799 RepID=A0A7G2CLP8_9TRYP|nr:hypothetical protein AGDE_15553 [Angomonas deanei]CAD2220345.1 Cilia BBSome complex subunit 10, putative [Angomonas deanei]|eukprot:EPY18866.1 hypothetical protein AGDE_15553 [Angomonas deanei]
MAAPANTLETPPKEAAAAEDQPPLEVLPEKGLVFSETTELQPLLCKPKLLPIKSYSLERLEQLEKKIMKEEKERREREKEAKKASEWK